jgi:hypothetical protein
MGPVAQGVAEEREAGFGVQDHNAFGEGTDEKPESPFPPSTFINEQPNIAKACSEQHLLAGIVVSTNSQSNAGDSVAPGSQSNKTNGEDFWTVLDPALREQV